MLFKSAVPHRSLALVRTPIERGSTTLAGERTTLFMGETLNGLLLNAWGWSVIGMIATLAGWILIALGAALFLLPLANWRINIRDPQPVAAA